jgi:hypothetical protein
VSQGSHYNIRGELLTAKRCCGSPLPGARAHTTSPQHSSPQTQTQAGRPPPPVSARAETAGHLWKSVGDPRGHPRKIHGESAGPAENPRRTRGTPRLTRALLGTIRGKSAENPRVPFHRFARQSGAFAPAENPRAPQGHPRKIRGESAGNPRRIRGTRGAPASAPAAHPRTPPRGTRGEPAERPREIAAHRCG